MLTRPEGKPITEGSISQVVECTLNDLDEKQCNEFVEKFPFTTRKKGSRKDLLLRALKDNAAVKTAFPAPMNAAMICRLYDDDTCNGEVKNELDIYKALMGVYLKVAEIKMLDIVSTGFVFSSGFSPQKSELQAQI